MADLKLHQIEYLYTNLLANELGVDNSKDWEDLHKKVKAFSKARLGVVETKIKKRNCDNYELCG